MSPRRLPPPMAPAGDDAVLPGWLAFRPSPRGSVAPDTSVWTSSVWTTAGASCGCRPGLVAGLPAPASPAHTWPILRTTRHCWGSPRAGPVAGPGPRGQLWLPASKYPRSGPTAACPPRGRTWHSPSAGSALDRSRPDDHTEDERARWPHSYRQAADWRSREPLVNQ